MTNYIENSNAVGASHEQKWIGDAEKAVAIDPSGLMVAIRYGNEVIPFSEVEHRLKNGEMGDDLPILMSDFGVDYDAACAAVFGGHFKEAIDLLHLARHHENPGVGTDGSQTPSM